MEPHEPHETPSYEVVTPRYFGLAPRGLVAAIAGALLLGTVAAFAVGATVVAALLLVAAVLLGALLLEGTGAVPQAVRPVRFAVATVRAWTDAAVRLVLVRLEARRLGRRRSALQYELGGAAYADDAGRVEELKTSLVRLDARRAACARRERAVVEEARRRTREERSAIAATLVRHRA